MKTPEANLPGLLTMILTCEFLSKVKKKKISVRIHREWEIILQQIRKNRKHLSQESSLKPQAKANGVLSLELLGQVMSPSNRCLTMYGVEEE